MSYFSITDILQVSLISFYSYIFGFHFNFSNFILCFVITFLFFIYFIICIEFVAISVHQDKLKENENDALTTS